MTRNAHQLMWLVESAVQAEGNVVVVAGGIDDETNLFQIFRHVIDTRNFKFDSLHISSVGAVAPGQQFDCVLLDESYDCFAPGANRWYQDHILANVNPGFKLRYFPL